MRRNAAAEFVSSLPFLFPFFSFFCSLLFPSSSGSFKCVTGEEMVDRAPNQETRPALLRFPLSFPFFPGRAIPLRGAEDEGLATSEAG